MTVCSESDSDSLSHALSVSDCVPVSDCEGLKLKIIASTTGTNDASRSVSEDEVPCIYPTSMVNQVYSSMEFQYRALFTAVH